MKLVKKHPLIYERNAPEMNENGRAGSDTSNHKLKETFSPLY